MFSVKKKKKKKKEIPRITVNESPQPKVPSAKVPRSKSSWKPKGENELTSYERESLERGSSWNGTKNEEEPEIVQRSVTESHLLIYIAARSAIHFPRWRPDGRKAANSVNAKEYPLILRLWFHGTFNLRLEIRDRRTRRTWNEFADRWNRWVELPVLYST